MMRDGCANRDARFPSAARAGRMPAARLVIRQSLILLGGQRDDAESALADER
jgi:hypothetical protein